MKKNENDQTGFMIGQINRLKQVRSVSESQDIIRELGYISERLTDKTFRIAVVGEFSSGKSTFINSIVGKDVLSHAVSETTAAITYIHNVPSDDPKNGTCVVKFRNGEVKEINDLIGLKEYTTAQSNNKVAETIDSVSVYVDFLTTDYPIMIMDTPGLNGIAKHHEQITINEVKKAHMCIYLLSLKGVTKSDVTYINMLSEYQNSFLFLQNFIDELNSSEGETAADKITDDTRIIEKYVVSQKKSIKYNIIGISALKALAAKDTSIRKLYNGDLGEITDADRKRLLKESLIGEFEAYLKKIIETGEYQNVIIDSVSNRLMKIMNSLLDSLDEQQKLYDELRKNDSASQRIQIADKAKAKLEENRKDRERRINNFIISQKERYIRELRESCKSGINDIYDKICDDIDSRIKVYDDYENFKRINGSSPATYYGEMITENVNKGMIAELSNNIKLLLNHLYEEAISRISDYTQMSLSASDIKMNINAPNVFFKMDDSDYRTKINGYKSEMLKCSDGISACRKSIDKNRDRISSEQRRCEAAKRKSSQDEDNYRSRVSSLGRQPDVREWTTYTAPYPVPRDGLLGKIGDIFLEPKTRRDPIYHVDDTDRKAWNEKKCRIDDEYYPIRDKNIRAIREIEENISEMESDIDNCQYQISSLEKKKATLDKQIQYQCEIYEREKKINEQKFCDRQKSVLKREVELQLYSDDTENGLLYQLGDFISQNFERNYQTISDTAINMYRSSLKEQEHLYDEIINENSQQLEQKFGNNQEEIELIRNIYGDISRNIEANNFREE